jgi:hypothetical protein
VDEIFVDKKMWYKLFMNQRNWGKLFVNQKMHKISWKRENITSLNGVSVVLLEITFTVTAIRTSNLTSFNLFYTFYTQ